METQGRGRLDQPRAALARYPAEAPPCFLVFIDTEEEFDWSAPLSRTHHATRHVRAIPTMQHVFDANGVAPTYLVDHPIVQSDAAVDILGAIRARGGCAIGAQLHPWVNPPFEEALTPANSFAGSLAAPVERAKIAALTGRITERFGVRPLIYRAGRYGVGPNSAAILEELGYRLDVSVRAGFDYSAEGGPDFTRFGLDPFWAGAQGRLLALPLGAAYIGALRRAGARLYRLAGAVPHARGALARTRLLARIPLTPEGVPVEDAKEAIRVLAGEGTRVFSLSFHSPSLEPGHTDYVRDAGELKAFYRWWEAVFDLFGRLGVAPMRADAFIEMMAQARIGR